MNGHLKNPWRTCQQGALLFALIMIVTTLGTVMAAPLKVTKSLMQMTWSIGLLWGFVALLVFAGVCWVLARVRDEVDAMKALSGWPTRR